MSQAERDLTLEEVLELLDIPESRLRAYRFELRDELRLWRDGRRLVFSAKSVARLRSLHEERKAAVSGPFPGLTTDEVSRRLKIPRSTVGRYAGDLRDKLNLKKFNRRLVFTEEAVEEIRRYHEFRRDSLVYGRTQEAEVLEKAKEEITSILAMSAALQQRLEAALGMLKPLRPSATGFIHTLPGRRFHLLMPIGVTLTAVGPDAWVASLPEARLQAEGCTREEALRHLRKRLSTTYRDLLSHPKKDPEVLAALADLIRVRRSRGRERKGKQEAQ